MVFLLVLLMLLQVIVSTETTCGNEIILPYKESADMDAGPGPAGDDDLFGNRFRKSGNRFRKPFSTVFETRFFETRAGHFQNQRWPFRKPFSKPFFGTN